MNPYEAIFMDPEIIEAARQGTGYKVVPELFFWEKVKIFFGLMKRPRPIWISSSLKDMIPTMKFDGMKIDWSNLIIDTKHPKAMGYIK